MRRYVLEFLGQYDVYVQVKHCYMKPFSSLQYFITGVGLLQLCQCVQPPDYPIEPVIVFENITPKESLQAPFFERPDTVYTDITFSFTDGDGDIGSDSSTLNVEIKDLRAPLIPQEFQLPKVDPGGAGNGISGDVRIRVPANCCIPDPINGIPLPPCEINSPSGQLRDTVVYSIRIRDRAGHWSNTIETTPVVLICRQ
jgi:hypothetical protein